MFENLNPKEWLPALISGVALVLVTVMSLVSGRRTEQHAREDKQRATEVSDNLGQARDLTARFRTLMEGYENRIKDLTAELAIRRLEQEKLEQENDELRRIINARPSGP